MDLHPLMGARELLEQLARQTALPQLLPVPMQPSSLEIAQLLLGGQISVPALPPELRPPPQPASAGVPFIDETHATHMRAHGYTVSMGRGVAPDSEAAPAKPKKRRRQAERFEHNDGYCWMKYGQKAPQHTVLPLSTRITAT